ncbi:polyprenyl synthetase family protein [Corynebacterium sp. TAE3-ERU12]|uniref:polyprenyl synthetase family protein n=1 Tax=Corynebacterium sp. TAE3-ERU12 TaxID=2849491 RepID=UPI001C43762A|nr:polyprenyl synthetase family protein [Corynebacterium sp. TAE3-ERU12]MBV7294573.1 polyprenyl synthetase family protein [Corynebacterium sp. TAE3-ERU12]
MLTAGSKAQNAQRTGGRGIASVSLGDPELEATITAGMQACEERIDGELGRGEDFLTEHVTHLAAAGGKRFRPMLAVLAAQFGTHPDSPDVITAATVVELTHLATLYHDDVMDEADMRRGVPSANARWNNSVAILAGDLLFSSASHLLAELGTDAVAHFAETFRILVTGQMRESLGCPEGGDQVEHYLKVIEEKTGVLIATAGHLGAKHAGADEATVRALSDYGHNVGMVFQIVDDIIDISSKEDESGKIPGTDLREGVFTLPVLYAMREDTAVGARLREILTGPVTDDGLVDEALGLLSKSNGAERALADVRKYSERAEAAIADLPDIPAKSALRRVLDYTADRVG